MKSNGFSRRGLLMGAATLAVSRLKAADDTTLPTMELQQMAEGVSGASVAPPFAYVGCYTGGSNARGISVFHYDQVTNEMTLVGIVAPVTSPSFVVLDASRRFLYSGNESGSGSASAFSINPQTGALRFLNSVGTGGQPAHVIVHPGGKYLLTANYTGGTVAAVPIQADGSLGTTPQIISHFGNLGPNAGRQEAPHPHMVLPDSTGKYVLVNDLGLDATIVYSFDAAAGKLTEVNRIAAAGRIRPEAPGVASQWQDRLLDQRTFKYAQYVLLGRQWQPGSRGGKSEYAAGWIQRHQRRRRSIGRRGREVPVRVQSGLR